MITIFITGIRAAINEHETSYINESVNIFTTQETADSYVAYLTQCVANGKYPAQYSPFSVEIPLLETIDTDALQRTDALSKLTDAEKVLLGLT